MSKIILLIEDNDGDQFLIKEALSESDLRYDLIMVKSGEDGVAQAILHKPNIAIVDTNLPGMDGFETCQKLKESCGDSIKIIVMTGLIDAVDAGRARDAGADDYCVKTMDYTNLVDAVRKCF